MKINIKALKDAFMTECNRVTNLSIGRDYFQDYEVASFLNNAYYNCVNKRLSILDERFMPAAARPQAPPGPSLASDQRIVQEMGDLYIGGQASLIETYNTPRGVNDQIAYKDTRHFAIPFINSAPLYLLTVQILEPGSSNTPAQAYICRPLTVSDAPKFTMLYRGQKYMPYMYYRIRKNVFAKAASNVCSGKPTEEFYVEINCPSAGGGKFVIAYEGIAMPPPITENDIAMESTANVAVLFGYEIAEEAAILAMRSMGEKH
ncbi:hypothetical protein [Azobacteroides phage ProJPt-Bp1]|uniref:Uncharacterized protein n=1 Tax=Azobacteroides phage ProJPt-Bp1 TaxID=1920526 RepID=A0A1V1FY26_9CAUD|nr:hypothetical protein KNT10_gp29 [Azobacteroides phage ProJPt-Bp1]BAX03434.1 hypothetical protein [Azobacteroides phage ProJPt-Bp1]